VGFEVLSQGIRIRGTWYPILKMEWIDGEPLNSYIERNLANPAALSSLAAQWRETLSALRQAEIAHGDLQHGNVLVSQGKIRLIDYDGMYVPALAGLVSHEEGHRNYQHPARDGREFGPHLDAFSGWVVLLSLVALGVDPRMWQRLNAGDECLLFRRDDFENPAGSKAFQAILAARTPELRFLARQVQSFLALPPAQVPALDTVALNLPDSRLRPAPLPDWLTHNRQAGPLEDVPSLPSLDDGEGGWEQPPPDSAIEQVLASTDPLELWGQTDFTGERIAAATTLVVSLFLGIGALVSFVPAWLPLAVGTILMTAVAFIMVVGYRSHPRTPAGRLA
jgi:serine/threonine protein kinase